MRGYYLMAWSIDNPAISGVKKKILDQLACLQSVSDIDLVMALDRNRPIIKKMTERLPLQGLDPRHLYESLDDADFLYVRKWQFGRNTFRFFEMMKERNPNLKIIVEIPTYPYDGEAFKSLLAFNFDLQDRGWRNRFASVVDRYVVYSSDTRVFDVETIRTVNGIDVNRVPLRCPKPFNSDEIELIAVANPLIQHGYDRIIRGLKNYYATKHDCEVRLTLVGDGPIMEEYRKLANELDIQEKVSFPGALYDEDLTAVFDRADVALGIFGNYRIGCGATSALKVREYLARGLPVINGCTMDVLDPVVDSDLYLEFPNNDTDVDITKIVSFYREIMKKWTISEKAHEIRKLAEERVSMDATMQPILSYLFEN